MPATAIIHTPGDDHESTTTTVENVVRADTEFGNKNTVVLEHPDGSTTDVTGFGVCMTGFTEET